MAKAVALLTISLCALAVVIHAQLHPQTGIDRVTADGGVICDQCRQISPKAIIDVSSQAKVELRCRSRKTGKLTLVAPDKADDGGYYRISVKDNYADDICRVRVVSSSDPMCNIIVPGLSSARVRLFANDGNATIGPFRYVNLIGFMRKEPLPNCHELIEKMNSRHRLE